jgi:aryl-alcohol dehydrogenase-like predicted oxidoreductase
MPRKPLAGGLLTGRQHSRQDLARLRRRGLATTLPSRRRATLVAALAGMAIDLGVTPSAVALAWLLTRPGVTAPIVNVTDVTQLETAMSAVRLQLTRQQVSDLDRLSGA